MDHAPTVGRIPVRTLRRSNRITHNGNGNGSSKYTAVMEQMMYNTMTTRAKVLQQLIDPRRDINAECGYPDEITIAMYRQTYDREGIAARVVDVFPDECWAVDPVIVETAYTTLNSFEQAWLDLDITNNILHYLHRVDRVSGIGQFGVLLLGLSDTKDLTKAAKGVGDDGVPSKEPGSYKLLFVRAFDQTLVSIKDWELDLRNPRYGLPKMYTIKQGHPQQVLDGTQPPLQSMDVHWSRIIHVADDRVSSEVFGTPRLQSVFNRVLDISKLLAGSAEMFWKGAFPGYSFELMPNLIGEVEMDKESMRLEFEKYSNGLQRYLALTGVTAKSLEPQVASPEYHMDAQIQALAIAKGVPVRVFIGSEEAKLASTQDARTWNKRLRRRQSKYLAPMLVRPFADRLIALGILPPPEESPLYKITWPDLNSPTDSDKASVAVSWTEALTKYVQSGLVRILPPEAFLTFILEIPLDKAKAMLENSKDPDGSLSIKLMGQQIQGRPTNGLPKREERLE